MSGSFFYIDGNDNFTKPEDYSGTFETISGSIYIKGHKAGVYYSYSDTCFTIGVKVGISTTPQHLLPFDFSYSNTIYPDPLELCRVMW